MRIASALIILVASASPAAACPGCVDKVVIDLPRAACFLARLSQFNSVTVEPVVVTFIGCSEVEVTNKGVVDVLGPRELSEVSNVKYDDVVLVSRPHLACLASKLAEGASTLPGQIDLTC